MAGTAPQFTASYTDWSNPANGFVVDGWTQNSEKRVLWQQSDITGNGNTDTTVSEGMGYGLLLAYANDDQTLFDQFLNYVVNEAQTHGCASWDQQSNTCTQSALLMPWLVDHTGAPFNYHGNNTSGSATDADIQIAWAVGLATQLERSGGWKPYSTGSAIPSNLASYADVYSALVAAISRYDLDPATSLYTPGNQWGSAGKTTMFSGYFTPQAFGFFAANPPVQAASAKASTGCQPATTVLCVQLINNAGVALHADYVSSQSSPSGQPSPQWSPALANGQYTPTSSVGYSASFLGKPWTGQWAVIGFDLAAYGASGAATTQCPYQFNMDAAGMWIMQELSGKDALNCSISSDGTNSFTVTVSAPPVDWSAVTSASLAKISQMQAKGGDSSGHLLVDKFDPQSASPIGWGPGNSDPAFGSDGSRFPLWVGGCLLSGQCQAMRDELADLTDFFRNHLQNDQLPATGYLWSETAPFGQALRAGTPVPASQQVLNVTGLVAAAATGDQQLYDSLVAPATAYSLANPANQPHPGDNSVPYFNATLTLLAAAMFEPRNSL